MDNNCILFVSAIADGELDGIAVKKMFSGVYQHVCMEIGEVYSNCSNLKVEMSFLPREVLTVKSLNDEPNI